MCKARHVRLCVEQLEARCTPTVVLFYNSGSLMIRGTPTDTNTGLHVNGVAGNLQVLDGDRNLGRFHVTSNLILLLGSHPNDVTIGLRIRASTSCQKWLTLCS